MIGPLSLSPSHREPAQRDFRRGLCASVHWPPPRLPVTCARVQILAADHPRDAAGRTPGLEFGRPVCIGRNVWIGAGAIILPGVSIVDDALIGAGSVVTRDVPAGATAFGNRARLRASTAC
jgi:UDP-3-O-[3-hydroxymyristoyl] glucosamine N-acyltransferase